MDNTKTKKDEFDTSAPNGQAGIRATLNKMGFSDSKIGYDDTSGTVTLNGKNLMKPSYMDEDAGRSYAPVSEIQKSVVNLFKDSSNPIVRVSDAYAARAGRLGLSADSLTYGNGTVMIGGKPLDTLYIDDEGKAWAWQDDVDSLVSSLAGKSGVHSPNQILDRYDDEYLEEFLDRLESVYARKDFSYDPDDDPVYAAYKQKYLAEGDRASKNAIADYSALTGGYTNSTAMTAGAQAQQYYASKLSDMIPQLASDAYTRYKDKNQTNLDVAELLLNAYDTAYGNAADANDKTLVNVNSSASSSAKRDQSAFERDLTLKEFERDEILDRQLYDTRESENYWNGIFNGQKSEMNIVDRNSKILDNEQKQIYNELYQRLIESEISKNNSASAKSTAEARAKYGY